MFDFTRPEWQLLLKQSVDLIGFEQYFHAEVLIVLVNLQGKWHLLFQKRAAAIRQGGEICFPGGRVENGETGGETAARETSEELGISQSAVRLFGYFGTVLTRNGTKVDAYLGELLEPLEILHPNINEVETVFTYPIHFFLEHPPQKIMVESDLRFKTTETQDPIRDYDLPRHYQDKWKGRTSPVWVYPLSEGPLWGLTAELVRELVSRMLNEKKPFHNGRKKL